MGTFSGFKNNSTNPGTITLTATAVAGDVLVCVAGTGDDQTTHRTATVSGVSLVGGGTSMAEQKFQASGASSGGGCGTLLTAVVTGSSGTPVITPAGGTGGIGVGWILTGAGSGTPAPTFGATNATPNLGQSITPSAAGSYAFLKGNNHSLSNITGNLDSAVTDVTDSSWHYRACHKTGAAAGTYTVGLTTNTADNADWLVGAYFNDASAAAFIAAKLIVQQAVNRSRTY